MFGGTYDSGVFLAVPLPLFYTERGRKPSGDPSEDHHPHRHLKSGTPCRVSELEVKACEVRLSPHFSVAEGVFVAKVVPTYTGGSPRETRFEELELFFG